MTRLTGADSVKLSRMSRQERERRRRRFMISGRNPKDQKPDERRR